MTQSEMHPVMQVDCRLVDGKPEYTLSMSRANFNDLAADCDRLIGDYGYKTHFDIFPGDRMPTEFSARYDHPPIVRGRPAQQVNRVSVELNRALDDVTYWANVGVPAPIPEPDAALEEFDALSDRWADDLETAINTSGRIPIRDTFLGEEATVGYVVMRVESEGERQTL